MFGIGWSEFVVIGVVALIAIGPKELPGVLRMLGNSIGKVRRMANEFQGQFQEAMREAEMADVRKELDDISQSAADVAKIDPLGQVSTGSDSVAAATPAEPATLPEISVPMPEPLPPPTEADFLPAPPSQPANVESASDLLPPSPKVG